MYQQLRGDYTDAKQRLMNDGMITRFVLKFPSDPSMQLLRESVAKGDIETSFRAVHTLKSVAGVLGFTPLYEAAVNLTEQLRPRLEQANRGLLSIVEERYVETMAIVSKFAEEQPK